MRNIQEQVNKASYQKLFWPFTVWINCSSDLKFFANSCPSASNFKSFSQSLEQFFLTVGQNNFGNKIPWFWFDFFAFQGSSANQMDRAMMTSLTLLPTLDPQRLCVKIFKTCETVHFQLSFGIYCTYLTENNIHKEKKKLFCFLEQLDWEKSLHVLDKKI